MQKVRVPITNFQFGEISDSTIMRTDSPVYQASAQRVENLLVRAEGGVVKRAGLRNLYDFELVRDTTKRLQLRLMPFIFSDDERYIIAVEDAKVRCFRIVNGTITLVATLTQDTNTNALPFDEEYLHEYTYAQSGDVLFICHPLFAPRMIIRTGLTSFECTPYSFDERSDGKEIYQPYSVFHPASATLDPSASSGTGVTFTISIPYFTADHVGVTMRYGKAEFTITSVTSSTVAVGNIIDELKIRLSVINPLRTIDNSAVIEVTQIGHGYEGGETIIIDRKSVV